MKLSSPLLRVEFKNKIRREMCLSAKAPCHRPNPWPWCHLFLHLPHPPPHWQRASLGALWERLHAKLDTLQAEPSSSKGNTCSTLRQLAWPGWRKREGRMAKQGIAAVLHPLGCWGLGNGGSKDGSKWVIRALEPFRFGQTKLLGHAAAEAEQAEIWGQSSTLHSECVLSTAAQEAGRLQSFARQMQKSLWKTSRVTNH